MYAGPIKRQKVLPIFEDEWSSSGFVSTRDYPRLRRKGKADSKSSFIFIVASNGGRHAT
jgi:hypothetical protein